MAKREETYVIKIGKIFIGGHNKILIQSMTNVKTEQVDLVVSQINECARLGADLMRISVIDKKDAAAIREIKKQVDIPLVADIHYNYKLALLSIENGIDAIRLNPGNINDITQLREICFKAKKHNIPIRVGVNSGSSNDLNEIPVQNLIENTKDFIYKLESLDFKNIVISIKGSNVLETIEANRIISDIFPKYPLHLGLTEAGFKDISLIRSTACLSPLLLDGIGNTIRISISGNPKDEIIAAKRLLHDIGLYPNYPTIISCPTCGRTQVDVISLSKKIMDYLEAINKPVKVAVMGCFVNGIGEANNADIGVAGGNNEFFIFKNKKIIKKVDESNIFVSLKEEIDKL